MNKRVTILITLMIITILGIIIILNNKNKPYEITDTNNGQFAFYYQNNEGNYVESDESKWSTGAYVLNLENSICDGEKNPSFLSWNDIFNSVVITRNKATKCSLYFTKKENDFSFTGDVQEFVVPLSGFYKLEVWGAQGGTNLNKTTKDGGLGGYSSGEIFLYKGETLYVVVGGQGSNTFEGNVAKGGFNGGGDGLSLGQSGFGGGGATHIAKVSGELSALENDRDAILIVAGGGGGNGDRTNNQYSPDGGVGGGLKGGDGFNGTGSSNYLGHGGSQTNQGSCPVGTNGNCGSFGHGGNNTSEVIGGAGGGGGFYGGSQSSRGHAGGGGGSGYIGNPYLAKAQTLSGNETFPATDEAEEAGHYGNGFAKITLIRSLDENELLTKAVDLSGNSYDGEFIGNVKIQQDDEGNQGLYFDGNESYVDIADLPETIKWNDGFSYEFEAKWLAFNNYSRIFDFGNGTAKDNMVFCGNGTSNNAYPSIYYGGLSHEVRDNAVTELELNKRVKIKVSYEKLTNGFNELIYKDGILVRTKFWETENLSTEVNRTTNYLGKSNWGESFFNGYIYNIKFIDSTGKIILCYNFEK